MGRVIVAGILLAACGFESHSVHEDGGAHEGPDAGATCLDRDGDGFGEGGACAGPDCLDDDPTRHECVCDAEGIGAGCPCGPAEQPVACYDGPPGTAGVGTCAAGLRRCEGGRWTGCLGQIQPAAAEVQCDFEDEDCDGVVDDGVSSPCGDCNGSCSVHRYGVGGEPFPVDDDPAPLVGEDGSITIAGNGELRAVVTIQRGTPEWWCGRWGPLDLSANVPAGASVVIEARSSWSNDFEGVPWERVLRLPGDAPPVALPDSVSDQSVLELRVTLLADDPDRLPVVEWITFQETSPGCGFE